MYGKRIHTGQFFEEVGHRLVGGELCRNGSGDIYDGHHSTSYEVKSSGSHHGYRLDVDQIRDYAENICGGFPSEYGRYLFFAYHNPFVRGPKSKRRRPALAKYHQQIPIRQYLASNISWCTLVDLSIVDRWRAVRPIVERKEVVPDEREDAPSLLKNVVVKMVDVKCREIAHLANGGFREELSKIEFDPAKYEALETKVSLDIRPDLFQQYWVTFPFVAIVPKADTRLVQSLFKKRGIHLARRSG